MNATLGDEIGIHDKSFFVGAESTVLIYQSGSDYLPVDADPIYMGPQCHTVEETEEPSRRVALTSGKPFSDDVIDDYGLTLDIQSEWTHQERAAVIAGGSGQIVEQGRVPLLTVDRRYVIVAIWQNRRRGNYVKRTYFNCRVMNVGLSNDRGRYKQVAKFRVSWRQHEVGSGDPGRNAALAGVIRHTIGGTAPQEIYSYNMGSKVLTQLVSDAVTMQTVEMEFTGDGGWILKLGGVQKARVTGTPPQLAAANFVERMPRTGEDTRARAEFWIGPWRTLVVDDGSSVFAPRFWEKGAPTGAAAFNWWLRHFDTDTEIEMIEI